MRQLRLQEAGGAQPRRTVRARRGRLRPMRHAIFVRAQAFSRRSRRRAIRSAGVSRTRRARVGVPRDRPQAARPLGGAQGLVELGGRRRHGRRCGRSPHVGRGEAPEHRRGLQLRRASRFRGHPRRLHRHGVRRRQVAQTDPRRPQGPASSGPCPRLHRRDRTCARLPARGGLRLLRLQAGQRHADRRAAQAHRPGRGHRHGRRRRRDLRDARLPGPGDRLHGPHRRE